MFKLILYVMLFFVLSSGFAQNFSRITQGSIVSSNGNSYGVAWGDYDNDGYADLFVTNGGEDDNFLYHNNGNGTFTRITTGDIVNNGDGSNASWGDCDNDGDLDLFVSGGDSYDKLYVNNGDGTFNRIQTGVFTNEENGKSGTWGDYNNDGFLDLFVAGIPALYENNGDNTFTDVTSADLSRAGVNRGGANWVDYDNDGDLDLFIVNNQSFLSNKLLRNDGDDGFIQVTNGEIVNESGFSSSSSWADYDNDGDLDVFIAKGSFDEESDNSLYRNNGDGTFTKITDGEIVNDGGYSQSSSWADYDNDGDLDLFVSNSSGDLDKVDFLYSNNGDGTFTKINSGVIVTTSRVSLGAAWADYDNDGDQDLFVAVDNSLNNLLYRNNGNSNNWINIKCNGNISNASAIGAKVRIKAHIFGMDVWQMRELSGQTGAGLGSQNSLDAEFGLGDATQIDSMVIEWPSGVVQDSTEIAVNQFLNINERLEANISVSPAAVNFGSVFVNTTAMKTITINNHGSEMLDISSVAVDLAAYSVDTTSFSLELGESRDLEVIFLTDTPGEYAATLNITSNDPDTPLLEVALNAEGIYPPQISVSPESVTTEINSNDSTQQVMTISNDGASDLTYEIQVKNVPAPGKRTVKPQSYPGSILTKADLIPTSQNNRRQKVVSGRTAFKNMFTVTNALPELQWQLLYTDPDEADITYDVQDVYVAETNNQLLFKTQSNMTWPDSNMSGIYIYIDADQDTSTGYNYDAYGWDIGADYVIFYDYFYEIGLFQWNEQLQRADKIDTLTTLIDEASSSEVIIGIDNKYFAMQPAINLALINFRLNDYSIDFVPDIDAGHITYNLSPPWIHLSAFSGTIPAAGQQDITMTFDAGGLFGGTYNANILINNNDPEKSRVTVPVQLDVTGVPDIQAESDSVVFEKSFVNYSDSTYLIINNTGTDILHLSNISVDNPLFTVSPTSASINYLSGDTLIISFMPDAVGTFEGSLTIDSDDPDEPSIQVSLIGHAVDPPEISVTPQALSAELLTNESKQQIMTIENNGASELVFAIDGMELSTPGYGNTSKNPHTARSLKIDESLHFVTHREKNFESQKFQKTRKKQNRNNLTDPQRWTLLYSDPDEAEISYDIKNIYADMNGTELLFRLETFLGISDTLVDGLTGIYIDVDQDTTTGFDAPSSFGWHLGIDYVISYLNGFGNDDGLYKYNSITDELDWIEPLTTASSELGSHDLIIGVNRNFIGKSSAINFAVQSKNVFELFDRIPDLQKGYITYDFIPPWLDLSSAYGTIPAGEQMDIAVTFNADDLFGGLYEANILILSNDPAQSLYTVHAQLDVTGRPLISVEKDTMQFGEVFVDIGTSQSLLVENIGTELLEINTELNSAAFSMVSAPSSILPMSQDTIWISFLPDSVTNYSSTLTITSNDTSNNPVYIPLFGEGVIPPAISVDPDSFHFSINDPAMTDTMVAFTISNTGGSNLQYTIQTVTETSLQAKIAAKQEIYLESLYKQPDKGQDDDRRGPPVTDGHGGPDNFGYHWTDSDDPEGPQFNWIEINTLGTELDLSDDENSGFIDLGFDFTFYGQSFDQIAVCSNGWISFSNTSSGIYNLPLPYMFAPENMIALLASDLDPGVGSLYYYHDVANSRFIVEYENWGNCCDGAVLLSMQVILYYDGRIVFQYQNVQQAILNGSIGIQNGDKTDGLTVAFNNNYVKNNLAIEFRNSSHWLRVDSPAGVIAPDGNALVHLIIDADGLSNDTYKNYLKINSNVPGSDAIFIPVQLFVDLITALDDHTIMPTKIHLAQNYPNPFNPTTTIKYNLPSAAQVNIIVFDTLGREIIRLVDQEKTAGYHQVIWDGSNKQGTSVASGMYLYYMVTRENNGQIHITKPRKLILLK